MTRAVYGFRVTGRVQGVGYRWFARAAAARFGLFGWVANHADGSVVGEVYGDTATVDAFLAQLEQGPAAAAVDRVTRAVSASAAESFTSFEIRQ